VYSRTVSKELCLTAIRETRMPWCHMGSHSVTCHPAVPAQVRILP